MTGSLRLNLTAPHRPEKKKVGCSANEEEEEESASTRLIVQSETTTTATMAYRPQCCGVPYVFLVKQLGWRIRARWRHLLIRRRRRSSPAVAAGNGRGIRLNYDLRSYALNFDDGRFSLHDRRSPLAP